jgi:uncharacterized protein (TIGR03437 family)
MVLAGAAALQAATDTMLGVDFSEPIPFASVARIATDGAGAVYLLGDNESGPTVLPGIVTKLTPDGKTIVWQSKDVTAENGTQLGAVLMAVDSSGGVYVRLASQAGDTTVTVGELTSDGSGFAWKAAIPAQPQLNYEAMAVDRQGRVYYAGISSTSVTSPVLLRLTADGASIDYSVSLPGMPTSLAVDSSGTAYVGGQAALLTTGSYASFVAQTKPDGTAGYYTTLSLDEVAQVVLDASGNAVVCLTGTGLVEHLDATGAVGSSFTANTGWIALDATGNVYGTTETGQLYHTTNSIAPCTAVTATPGVISLSALLNEWTADGTVVQSTYLPVVVPLASVATGPNSTVYVAGSYSGAATTQTGPFASPYRSALLRLSPSTSAQTLPLVCVGNAASLEPAALAPGELVTLMGSGLGPEQGVQPEGSAASAYPTQASGVEVTFDGTPAPLLWVQDSQINTVVPWSVAGTTTKICVIYNDAQTNYQIWPVGTVDPGVFTNDGYHAATVNQDGTVNSASNPAARNSVVSIFATGLGATNPAETDGEFVTLPLPTMVMPVQLEADPSCLVTPSSCDTTVHTPLYAGAEAYVIAGVTQINLQASDMVVSFGVTNMVVQVQVNGAWVPSNPFTFYVASE